ncbi:polynucleotide kinase-phosphatase, partial [Candidatus Poribacteria bacterium]|nr:polynucleotide kinase-phosphatase [Candidatus Poribacteria bacterium]
MNIDIPDMALVLLVGASGSGKSTFAARHFLPTEVVSSDRCRGMVSDDETSMDATADAFDLVHYIARKRLSAGRVTVIDATNVQRFARQPLIAIAKELHCLTVAIVLDVPEDVCHARNADRPDRNFGRGVITRHARDLRKSLRGLGREGIHRVYTVPSQEEVDAATITRVRLWPDRRDERGPFDIIGDVHGCCDELEALLGLLGYAFSELADDALLYTRVYEHPEGRKAVFVGDIVDRGPRVLDAYGLVRNMVEAGSAICVPGNHDSKLVRKLRGRKVQVTHGLQDTLDEIAAFPEESRRDLQEGMAAFFESLVSHAALDDGSLVVAHAGIKESMAGRASGAVRSFALYGDTTGETDEFGAPVRHDWAREYRGKAAIVYGHTPVVEAEWVNETINIDTGCVFGGRLTALRYPERELVSVDAREMYAEPVRPLAPSEVEGRTAQHASDDTLDIEDLIGRRFIETRLRGNITIDEEHGAVALEVLSRWAVDPKWLIYLPPTMAPPAATEREGLLEHPDKALAYYAREGVPEVICEEKHMGSRAVAIVCREPSVAVTRFGLSEERYGIVYTRTGRAFFPDAASEAAVLAALREGATSAGLWDTLDTDWLCLDCEIMPWSAKARELIEQQYASVGAAARASLAETLDTLRAAEAAGADVSDLRARFEARLCMGEQFVDVYRGYCWDVASPADLRVAPFHVLASEGATHTDRDHRWHMETLRGMTPAGRDSIVQATDYLFASPADDASREAAVD